MSESVAQGVGAENGGGTGQARRVSFSDVVRAHHRWDVGGADGGEARAEFEGRLAAFEQQSRERVVEAYWCRRQASGVALVQAEPEPPGGLRRLIERVSRRQPVPEFRLYRATDWETGELRGLADLLHECDILAIKASWGLEGIQRAVVMQWLLAVEEHVLGFVESSGKQAAAEAEQAPGGGAAGRRAAVTRVERFRTRTLRELSKVEDYYHQAGEKRARLHYVEGMILLGVPAVVILGTLSALILAGFGLLHLHDPAVRRLYACMAAGATGAIVSVLIRMSGRRGGFTTDHELGSVGVRRLGAFRPLIGAVSGVILSFLVQTSLVPVQASALTFQLYVVVAFLAGFSERWTKVVLEGAMRTIERVGDGEEDRRTRPAPRRTAPARGGDASAPT